MHLVIWKEKKTQTRTKLLPNHDLRQLLKYKHTIVKENY